MRLSVGKKIWSGLLSVLIIMLVIGATSLWSLFKLNKEYQFLIEDRMEKVVLLEQLLSTENEVVNNNTGFLLYQKEEFLSGREELDETAQTILTELDSLMVTESAREILEDVSLRIETYNAIMDIVIADVEIGNPNFKKSMAYESSIQMDMLKDGIEKLKAHQIEQRHIAEKDLDNLTSLIRIITISLLVIALVVSVIVAQLISKSIAAPVAKMTDAIKQMASGNFALEPINIKNKDEIGDMAGAFNVMMYDIRGMIDNTRTSAVQLAVQAEELSASSEESLAASEMVAEIAEKNLIASDSQVLVVQNSNESMEEMVVGINRITEDNEQMLTSTEEVSKLVKEGASLMNEFTEQMKTISSTISGSAVTISKMATQSEQIRAVTGMITAIAEQTNLLALNAAIEAARAGEHGKGFAVVAEEVRNLAEQSKQSAGEIGRMIDSMVENVSEAVSSTEDGNRRIDEGLDVTERTNEIFIRIESATYGVSEKVSTVSAAIEQIKAITETVSGGSRKIQELAMQTSEEAQSTSAAMEEQLAANEEISSSAQSLSEVAEQLQSGLSRFTI